MKTPLEISQELAVTITNLREVKMMYSLDNMVDLQKAITDILSSRLSFWAQEIKNTK